MNQDTDGYCAVINAARSLCTTRLDGKDTEGDSIDAETRDAARALLRAEFKRWSGDEEDAPEE